jgi:Ni,Fe-hydrogenase III small subunit/formate hydrogenlyase subunit 6/NADH:ubiquinone oxidoreductase subunit I
MFRILQKTFQTGIVTTSYPAQPAKISVNFRGRPSFDFERWRDARPGADVCPTGAISFREKEATRQVTIDYGRCVFCGLCAEDSEDGAVRMTREFELATSERNSLVLQAEYALNDDGTHRQLIAAEPDISVSQDLESTGQRVLESVQKILGRSLAIREVDAGSCNGCELEIVALNNPIYDIERFGIHFVASPRHADMLLVTGPVTRNMELALLKTYRAMPEPKLVAAVGACGISGGIFGQGTSDQGNSGRNYATVGSVDQVVPVDVYIPGCPPRPQALLQGILLALGRWL